MCAQVTIELSQQATLEREAFDARLVLNNNLGDTALTNLRVNVTIQDADNQPADGVFFTKVNSLQGVNAVDGGGVNGQAGAVRMGTARALQEFKPELRAKLKAEGFLRRDARGKERKKYGQKGARKRFQFSKR